MTCCHTVLLIAEAERQLVRDGFPAWEEKCRLGENLESGAPAPASGAGENWWEGCPGRGPGGWHRGHAHAPSLGEPPPSPPSAKERGPHKVTVEVGLLSASLPSFILLPSFFRSSFPLFTLPFSPLLSLVSPYSLSPSFSPVSLPHSLRTLRDPQCSRLDAAAGRESACPRPSPPSPRRSLPSGALRGWAEDGAVV